MSRLAGYTIKETIFESKRSVVYRAVRDEDGRPVVIKMPCQEYPAPDELARLRREMAMTSKLEGDGVIGAYALCKFQNSLAMVLEDFGGASLREVLPRQKPSLADLLDLGAEMARIIGRIHERHVMHKDVNPSNFVWNPDTGVLRIIDFGISTELSRETPAVLHPNVLEGTLAYMSPEQTGRMNRAIDYRTDLYSLGVTLFEMLTGQLPFAARDPMELVHCHIARVPPAAHEVRPDLPPVLSSIVAKLLQKRAEDRYESAHALAADLARAARELREKGRIEPFALGSLEASAAFRIPQKLYGRAREVEMLLEAFERVSRGAKEMMLVAGHSGIGKSALVHEVHKPIVRQRGFFISGKFDQFNRDIPYASLIQAFQGMVQQLLTESAERLAAWRERLSKALGPNAQVIIDVIPDVALIIGEQPPVPELPPAEAQNRFNLVFESFVRTLAAEDHPLALFLDDLQWADAPSLRLVELLMTEPETGHLFLIGAYRDNEVGPSHPLMFAVEEMKKARAVVHQITLGPLALAHCEELVADTLRTSTAQARELASICLDKTGGNPFFLNQFLLSLHDDGLVRFDRAAHAWRWDAAEIRGMAMTDNVVTLMAGKIGKLEPATRRAVELAACIGNTFDLGTLATVSGRSAFETAGALWPALREGLILPVGDAYKLVHEEGEMPRDVAYRFLHDRVQQAAYSRIDGEERKALHLRIGRGLLEGASAEERDERLFAILGHLGLGKARVETQEERDRIAELYLSGARKAKTSAAHAAALSAAKAGIGLVGESAWERRRDLTAALHVEAAEASQLTADWEGMERYAEISLAHSRSVLEQVKIYEIKIAASIAQAKIVEAVGKAVEVLHLLGVDFPADPQPPDVMDALKVTMGDLAATGREIEALADLPEATDPSARAALRILANITSATYIGRPALFPLIVFKQVSLSARHGNTNASAYGYATYGIILCGVVGDIDAGYRFGQMALEVSARFNAKEYEARTRYITCCYTRLWKEHVKETFRTFPSVYQAALESGDKEFAAWALMMRAMQGFYLGRDLREREPETARYIEIIGQLEQTAAYNPLRATHQAMLNLLRPGPTPAVLASERFDGPAMLAHHHATGESFAICNIHLNQAMLAYLFDDPKGAIANGDALDPFAPAMVSLVHVPVFYLYDALARLAVDAELSPEARAQSRARVEKQRAALEAWAGFAPENHLHKRLLVEGELARVDGRAGEARALFRRAIALARESEYQHEEALGNELLGKLWLAEEEPELARVYLAKARHLYHLWGAAAKAQAMERRWPELLSGTVSPGLSAYSTTVEAASNALDLRSLLKASQAIFGVVVLHEVLEKILSIALENAGAERGVLLLDKDGALAIEVEGTAGGEVRLRGSAPLEGDGALPAAIVHYVTRRRESLVLHDAAGEGLFTRDPYVMEKKPKSVLCVPLVNQGRLVAVLYLENNLTTGAFTQDRVEVLRLLSAQAALSLYNARLYASLEDYSHTLEQRVEERTRQLTEALDDLKHTQTRLVAQEKLAHLGLITSGIAHELKNPLNFVINFASLSGQLVTDLEGELDALKPRLGDEAQPIREIVEDLAQNASRIGQHGKRADAIVRAMLQHAGGGGGGQREATDLSSVAYESVRTASDAFQAAHPGFATKVETTFDAALRPVVVAPHEIGQVVQNLVQNALYAVWERARAAGPDGAFAPRVSVSTRDRDDRVEIRVRDNGGGIPAGIRDKIFLPFFTTKPTGDGTGLGLSLSHDIVAGHSGTLEFTTEAGAGTEFVLTLPKTGAPAAPT